MKIVKRGRGNNTVRPLTEEELRAEDERMTGLFRESAERDAIARQRIIDNVRRSREERLRAEREARRAEEQRLIREEIRRDGIPPAIPIEIGVRELDDNLIPYPTVSSSNTNLPVATNLSDIPSTRRAMRVRPTHYTPDSGFGPADRFRRHTGDFYDLNPREPPAPRGGRGLLDNEAEAMRNVLAMRKIVRKMPISRR